MLHLYYAALLAVVAANVTAIAAIAYTTRHLAPAEAKQCGWVV
jgi:hypothetical protein